MSNSLKRERSSSIADAASIEYDEWAKKLINRPIPQIGIPGIHQIGQIHQIVTDGVPANEGYDLDSAIGRFSWETIARGKHIPTIYRNGQQFCSIRMLESSILNDLLKPESQDIYDAAKLTSYFVTNAEAKLLTYINTWHCDGQYGAKNFSGQDLIVTLEESKQLYEYIRFGYDVLSSGGKNQDNDFSKCGFVRVNNDSLIPYTVLKDGEKSVPLFYFEGQTDILKEKAEPLTGWELAYLKICCRVQGVRKDLIAGDSLQIVKLAALRAYFPKRSTFEENCWPPPKAKSLLSKKNSISSTASNTALGAYYNNNLSVNGPKIPNRVMSYDNFQNRSNVRTSVNSASAAHTMVNRTQSVSAPDSNTFVRTNGNSTTSAIATNNGRDVNLTANNNSTAAGGMSMSNSITTSNGITIHLPHGPAPTPAPVQPSTRGSSELKRLRVPNPPADFSRLTTILEHSDGTRVGAYKVKTMIIEGDTYVHCINSKPFKTDEYLLVLQDLMSKYFPNVSIYPTAVSVLKSIGLNTFLPNSTQVATLNQYGFAINRAWEVPLVSATDAVALLPRIKLLLTPKPTPTRVGSAPYNNNTMHRNNNNNAYNISSATNSSSNRAYYYTNSNSTLGHAR